MKIEKKIKKILYVHYQLSELDGSNTHTSAFEHWFGEICKNQNIDFSVQSPVLSSKVAPLRENFWPKIRGILAKYYLRDFKLWLQNYRRTKQEKAMLEIEAPDIVLTRFGRGNVSIIWACRQLGIPVVLEINSPDIESITAHYRSLAIFNRLFSTANAIKYALGAFTVSDYLTTRMSAAASQEKILKTIPNGVDIDKFRPEIDGVLVRKELNIKKDSLVIGYVGSFAPWHGIDIIAEAFPLLLEQGFDVHLMLVGQVQVDSNSLIRNLLDSKHKDKISITGFIALQKIPDYLAAMDITVLANTEDYCSPLKIFEYMAMGKALLSVDTEAVQHIMRSEKEGLVFERGNSSQFQSQIKRLLEDKGLRDTLSLAARKRVVEKFQWKHNAQAVFNLLQECYQARH